MASYSPEIVAKKYSNWVKAHLAVYFTCEGIEPFVYDEIEQFQQKCLDDICASKGLPSGTTCSSCRTENVVTCPTSRICNARNGKCNFHRSFATQYHHAGCPNNICSKFKCEILSAHRYYSPAFEITDATRWCRNPWEVAKCFMPPDINYKDVTIPAETDFSGVISVIINHKGFQSKIHEQLGNQYNIFEKARLIGSDMRELSSLQLEDEDLQQYFTVLKSILSVPGDLATDENAREAKMIVKELEHDILDINIDIVQHILDEVAQAIKEDLKTGIDKQKKVIEKQNLDLITFSKKAVNKVKGTETLSSSELLKILTPAVTQVNTAMKGVSMKEAKKAKKEAAKEASKYRDSLKKLGQKFFKKESSKEENIEPYNTRPKMKIGTPRREYKDAFWASLGTSFNQAKKEYYALRKRLKQDMIKFYRDQYTMIPLSPLCDEHEAPLLNFYVVPEMNRYDVQIRVGSELKSSVRSLTDVFWTEDLQKKIKENKEIYVVADPGWGKTAFVKYLTLAWCQAHCPKPELKTYFKKEDLNNLLAFEFLYFIQLRDALNVCAIDDIILHCVIPNMPNCQTIGIQALQELLHHEKSLIIMDGMDEWTHCEDTADKKCYRTPKFIPHRNCRVHSTYITTLRRWKFSSVPLKNSEVDNRIELKELTREQGRLLEKKAISQLQARDLCKGENLLTSFDAIIAKNQLEDLVSNPLILMYLMCLFCTDPSSDFSKMKISSTVIDLYIARTLKQPAGLRQTWQPLLSDIPKCYREGNYHENYDAILMALGKLSFYSGFSNNQEKLLQCRERFAEEYLSEDNVKMCVLSGILTDRNIKTLIKEYTNLWFPYKTMQDYLCAVYISRQSVSDMEENFLKGCKNVQNVLDMSAVFEFVSGMNKKAVSEISRVLLPVINGDETTLTYRTMAHCSKMYIEPLKNIQYMYMSCFREDPESTEVDVSLHDIFITENIEAENYNEQLVSLVKHSTCDIRSVYIDDEGSRRIPEIVDLLARSDLSSIEKVYFRGDSVDVNLAGLLVSKLKCLTLIFKKNIFEENSCSISPSLGGSIVNLQHLEYVCISNYSMCHEVLEAILDMISSKKDMKEVRLHNLSCTDHGISCRGINLDLSEHSDLRRLGVGDLPISHLTIDASSLEECRIGELPKQGLASACFRQLHTAGKLHTLICSDLTSFTEIETFRQVLPSLVNVKHIALNGIDLSQGSLTLTPDMANIELIQLRAVTMSSVALTRLVKFVQNLPHVVTVHVRNCNITPEIELKSIKNYISSSDKFVVPFDGKLWNGERSFVFKTVIPVVEPPREICIKPIRQLFR
ncbi:uncharacterized protein LOC132713115 [Ruditapes philippinarum]|uniref:uncharacterized protein LOC132713115 n=1 Tax=Ruditapes philippinarum TaxID=129788 RepID=UPI00295C23E0|nr:uncharacterized protein LOC132713115 [Ruditapes philippinarum]XP_060551569.1 uncharacterized protein LOC132713115 [Ruditapes philippinarum]XP_060551570.1 uncharacterized protein LOC132713115 [Ruditapes philippinarum]